VLVDGIHHVATLTADTERLHANPDAVDGVHNKPGTPSARFPS
jgi:hypothetical protein